MKAAIYARYPSDNQRDTSIEDQVRLCRERAERDGWTVIGASSFRKRIWLRGPATSFPYCFRQSALNRVKRPLHHYEHR